VRHVNLAPKEVDYHRNGVGGNSFYVVTFEDAENGPMVGIVFSEPGDVAVFNTDELAKGNIAFGMGNSWRGDCYEDQLRQWVKEYQQAQGWEAEE
jgi:hypothetical protein